MRRAQFGAGARQRDLPVVARAREDRRARIPARDDRDDAAVLEAIYTDATFLGEVRAVYVGRDDLFDLIKTYAN